MAPSPTATPSASVGDEPDLDLTRLPKSVVPKRYELKLDVFPDEMRFEGLVNIRIFFCAPHTSVVWLHSVGLHIEEASIRFSQFALPVKAVEVIPRPDKDCIGVRFATPVEEGARAWLTLSFSGKISSNLEGFFSLPYRNKNGETKKGAATMFAATEARTCFPCFDEPEFKAVFALEVTVDCHLMVISNMPVMDSKYYVVPSLGDRRRRTDFFQWTKEMSTYLVCVVIGEFEYLETKAAGRTIVRVYAPWGQREQGRFAIEVSRKSLEFFNDYFGKRYPLPKLDLVALSRLSVGAMENWGIITCRETGLITELADANPITLQNIATLIAHEISHQWFGNLVTMKWWDGLYLNEGFATLMQYICIDKLYPEFEVFNRFCSDTVIPALGLDALQNSHPIEMPLKDASEISQVFDKITYCKGASVMFMLHEFIGADVFKEAIQDYMEQFSYDNATTEDLWHFLSSASHKDVGTILGGWIRELGFPVVKASCHRTEGDKVVLKLEQERFSSVDPTNRHMIWSIPLKGVYMDMSSEMRKFEILFDRHTAEIELKNFDYHDPSCWVKLNPKLTGFYRVHYCEYLFEALLRHLTDGNLAGIDRMGLFDDQVAMVLSDGGSTDRILRMVELFRDFETSDVVWRSVGGILQQIRTLTWPTEELADQFDQFCLDMLRPVLAKVGHMPRAGESNANSLLRAALLPMLAVLRDEEMARVAHELFQAHVDDLSPVPGSLRDGVFRAIMAGATGQHVLQQMLMLYRQSELAEERVSILGALGKAQDPDILAQVLEFALSPEVHAQEALLVLVSAAQSRIGHRFAWNFFVSNIDKIAQRYLGGLFLFSKLVKSVTENFCDREDLREVSAFFAIHKRKLAGSEQCVTQAEEHVRLNVVWREKDIDKIQAFLHGYFNS